MERHNKLDEAIKAKLGTLEDEPSARVWAGVRTEIGTVRPPSRNVWPMRIAAAITLLCVTALGYYLLRPTDSQQSSGMAVHRAKRIVVKPLDREQREGTFLAHQDDPKPEQQLHPGRQDQPRVIAPQPRVVAKDSLKNLQHAPLPEENPVEIVQHDAPKPAELPAPKAPDLRVPQLPDRNDAEVRTETAIASASSKRSYKVPGRDDLNTDNLRKKSGAILGAITNGANSFLGMNANYEERRHDDLKLTAFNADFGLFKIKKVRTVKN